MPGSLKKVPIKFYIKTGKKLYKKMNEESSLSVKDRAEGSTLSLQQEKSKKKRAAKDINVCQIKYAGCKGADMELHKIDYSAIVN